MSKPKVDAELRDIVRDALHDKGWSVEALATYVYADPADVRRWAEGHNTRTSRRKRQDVSQVPHRRSPEVRENIEERIRSYRADLERAERRIREFTPEVAGA
jgi:ribosome-binding protein aMBF1 (putative translation factor)